jgi:hypothetical protein
LLTGQRQKVHNIIGKYCLPKKKYGSKSVFPPF